MKAQGKNNWKILFKDLQIDHDMEYAMVNSTIVQALVDALGNPRFFKNHLYTFIKLFIEYHKSTKNKFEHNEHCI